MKETATLFCGVNAGYQGEQAQIVNPVQASVMVARALVDIQDRHGLVGGFVVHPGVVVYDVSRGCPRGGEAVAALKMFGNMDDVLKTAPLLREALGQTTLTVCLHGSDYGRRTSGFVVPLPGVDLHKIGGGLAGRHGSGARRRQNGAVMRYIQPLSR